MLEGYPFIFQMNDRSYSDELLEYTMQYRFKSSKSNHTYHEGAYNTRYRDDSAQG